MKIIWIALAAVLMAGIWMARANADRVVELPVLVSCSCDSAYRCMSDEDYMLLVGWNEENKYLWDCNDCR